MEWVVGKNSRIDEGPSPRGRNVNAQEVINNTMHGLKAGGRCAIE